MYVSKEKIEKAIQLFEEQEGVLRTSEVLENNIHQRTLYHMLEKGYIIKLERGLYKLANKETLSILIWLLLQRRF